MPSLKTASIYQPFKTTQRNTTQHNTNHYLSFYTLRHSHIVIPTTTNNQHLFFFIFFNNIAKII